MKIKLSIAFVLVLTLIVAISAAILKRLYKFEFYKDRYSVVSVILNPPPQSQSPYSFVVAKADFGPNQLSKYVFILRMPTNSLKEVIRDRFNSESIYILKKSDGMYSTTRSPVYYSENGSTFTLHDVMNSSHYPWLMGPQERLPAYADVSNFWDKELLIK